MTPGQREVPTPTPAVAGQGKAKVEAAAPAKVKAKAVKAETPAKAKPKTKAAPAGDALAEEARQKMIAEAAYYRAERRGFVGGTAEHEQDWAQAHAQIDANS